MACSEADKLMKFQVENYFPCPVYFLDRPDFLESVNEVSEEYLKVVRKKGALDEIYPLYMTDNYLDDDRVEEFVAFVGATAWNILDEQGYVMQGNTVTFLEMWTQEHHKHSAMEQHVHGGSSQLVGFYFLEVPDDSSRLVFHDPRAAKVQIDLPEKDIKKVTPASKMVNFTPKPGTLMFANPWLAHSLTSHAADKPLKFVHFNIAVQIPPYGVAATVLNMVDEALKSTSSSISDAEVEVEVV